MKKVIMFAIFCVGMFMITDAGAMFSRLSTLSKKAAQNRTYFASRVARNDIMSNSNSKEIHSLTDIQQELDRRDQKIQELENKNNSLNSVLVQMRKDLIELIEIMRSVNKSKNVNE